MGLGLVNTLDADKLPDALLRVLDPGQQNVPVIEESSRRRRPAAG
jgi:hypothetical protein